jgi:hypothetical protein
MRSKSFGGFGSRCQTAYPLSRRQKLFADQTKTNDFKRFGWTMTKITNLTVDKAYEIFNALAYKVKNCAGG